MTLHIVLWKWHQPGFRESYSAMHVNVIADQIRRHLKDTPYRIICITDDPVGISPTIKTYELWDDHSRLQNRSGQNLPSCYRRLRLFDPATQLNLGINKGDRIVWIDLDAAIVGPLRPVFERRERFVGWAVRGTHHIRVFNGSMLMFSQGDFAEIWHKFDPKTSPDAAHRAGFLGSDQAWISYNLARRTECGGWTYPVVVSFPREMRQRQLLPTGSAVVFFHGKRKPWHDDVRKTSPWLNPYWGPQVMGQSALAQSA